MTDAQGVLGKDAPGDIRYPLVYPLTTGSKIGTVIIGLIVGSLGVIAAFLLMENHPDSLGWCLFGIPALCLLMVPVYSVCYAVRAQITLEADAMEIREAFSTRRIQWRDIKGRRITRTRNGGYRVAVLRSGSLLKVQWGSFGLDARFNARFNALPDLDARDRAAVLAEVARDASLGADPAERLARLEKAKQLCKVLSFAAVALLLWMLFYPHPYGVLVACAAALPWLAVVLLWAQPGLFQIDGRGGDAKPNLGVVVAVPALLLGMRATMDLDVLDLRKLFLWGALAALPLFLVLVGAPRAAGAPAGGRAKMAFWMLLFTAAYGIGGLALADTIWDQAPATVYWTRVTGKHENHGKSTTYSVDLAPWNQDIGKNHFIVSSAYYTVVQQGDAACVRVHPGRFGLRWLRLGGCG
jgi:hypothetical protein